MRCGKQPYVVGKSGGNLRLGCPEAWWCRPLQEPVLEEEQAGVGTEGMQAHRPVAAPTSGHLDIESQQSGLGGS